MLLLLLTLASSLITEHSWCGQKLEGPWTNKKLCSLKTWDRWSDNFRSWSNFQMNRWDCGINVLLPHFTAIPPHRLYLDGLPRCMWWPILAVFIFIFFIRPRERWHRDLLASRRSPFTLQLPSTNICTCSAEKRRERDVLLLCPSCKCTNCGRPYTVYVRPLVPLF